jgi:transcriptional regulator with XRE-family HTH domain
MPVAGTMSRRVTRLVQHVGGRLRTHRLHRDQTLQDVARAVGLTHQQVSRIELGRTNVPIETMARFCVFYHISLAELLADVPLTAIVLMGTIASP